MTDSTTIGDRFKGYEAATRMTLPTGQPIILRVDGRAFHSLTRRMARPFDLDMIAAMDETAQAMCTQIDGTVLAYTQSDEISLLLLVNDNGKSEVWFGGVVQKMASIAASIATGAFNRALDSTALAQFDARVFTVPDIGEAANYLIWRQRDATRNSIAMAAQAKFSHKQLLGKNTTVMLDMLRAAGVDWEHTHSDRIKRGSCVRRVVELQPVSYIDKRTNQLCETEALRSRWEPVAAEHFTFTGLSESLVTS